MDFNERSGKYRDAVRRYVDRTVEIYGEKKARRQAATDAATALAGAAAVASLLIEKGVITEGELIENSIVSIQAMSHMQEFAAAGDTLAKKLKELFGAAQADGTAKAEKSS